MRTPEKWERQKPYILNRLFTPRLAQELQEFPMPKKFPEIDLDNGQGLFLYGPAKVGKTVYAAQFVTHYYKQWWLENSHHLSWKIHFISAPRLFRELKTSFDPKSRVETEDLILTKYESADLLILDDLGMNGRISEWLLEVLFMITDYRWENQKPTIITSNYGLPELAELFGDDRIPSRIERMCKAVKKTPYE